MKTILKRLALGLLWASPLALASADTNVTPGAGDTIFNYICQSTKKCPAVVAIDSLGVEKGTQTNPIITNPSGGTPQPITGIVTASGTMTANQGTGAPSTPWSTTLRQGGFDALVTSAGRLAVDIGSTSLTGTVNAVQSGVWTLQPGNTANTTPWLMTIKQGANSATVSATGALKVDGSAVNQPITGHVTVDGQPAANIAAATTGGCTAGHFLSAATNNATAVKSGVGTLCELVAINTSATTVDLRLYDTAGTPTCSSTTGVIANYPVQGNTVGPGFVINVGPFGKAFTNGLGICLTGANTDNDNTPAVTGINVNYSFK